MKHPNSDKPLYAFRYHGKWLGTFTSGGEVLGEPFIGTLGKLFYFVARTPMANHADLYEVTRQSADGGIDGFRRCGEIMSQRFKMVAYGDFREKAMGK